jgi:hypothetical protein
MYNSSHDFFAYFYISTKAYFQESTEAYFLGIFTVEASLKILALGKFIFVKILHSTVRNPECKHCKKTGGEPELNRK